MSDRGDWNGMRQRHGLQYGLAKNLERYRTERGMTPQQLADEVNARYRFDPIFGANIECWEAGTCPVDIYHLCGLAYALGCTPNDLIGWDDESEWSKPWWA